jgi:hypothetical protein
MTVYLNRRVPLVNGRGTVLVHAMDYELVSQYSWRLLPDKHTSYAVRMVKVDGKWTTQKMDQFITGQKNVDHVNRNGLDNRRSNLRTGATRSQQNANRGMFKNNTSGYIGVSWDERKGMWRGQVHKDRKLVWQGRFDDPVEAARARDAKALEHHGAFAVVNFP